MSVSSVSAALARCAGTPGWAVGMCGQFCAAMYGYGASGYADALAQWNQTPRDLKAVGGLHPETGALVFWGGGSAGHGHVAIADGTGSCWSIDISGPGTVSRVPVSTISERWGLPYLGWARPYFQGQEWSPTMIYGLDVAAFQPLAVPSRTPSDDHPVDFCFIKATQGTSYINPRMAAQAESARSKGMVVGFYHFLERGDIAAQCAYFTQHAASVEGDLLAIDWETNPATNTYPSAAEKDAAIRTVQELRPGHRVLLYCNTSFWKNIDTSSFAGDGLWIATAGYAAGQPPVQSPWVLHQYSTAGGYDHDVAQFSSRAELQAWAEEGSDVALTADDKTWIKSTIVAAIKAEAYGATIGKDAVRSPDDDPANPTWQAASYHRESYLLLLKLLAGATSDSSDLTRVLVQTETNGGNLTSALTKLDAIKSTLDAIDLSDLPAEIAAKLNGLKFVLQEGQ